MPRIGMRWHLDTARIVGHEVGLPISTGFGRQLCLIRLPEFENPGLVVSFSRDLNTATCPPTLNPFPSSDPSELPKHRHVFEVCSPNHLYVSNMNLRSNNRYGSQLHQRDARSQLFDNSGYGYPGDGRASPRIASAYRPAAPNSRGQYSASVLEELESQNDAQVEGLSAKVKMLKDVCCVRSPCDL